MKKSILMLTATLTLFSLNGLAGEYLAPDIIHTVTLTKDFSHCLSIYVSTKVGHLKNGQCEYEKETNRTLNNILFCQSGMALPLSGNSLQKIVGKGYQCAATRITDLYADPYSKTYALDEFTLITDSSGNYIGSTPAVNSVKIITPDH